MATTPLKTFSMEEIAKHNQDGDLWVVVDGKVIPARPLAHSPASLSLSY